MALIPKSPIQCKIQKYAYVNANPTLLMTVSNIIKENMQRKQSLKKHELLRKVGMNPSISTFPMTNNHISDVAIVYPAQIHEKIIDKKIKKAEKPENRSNVVNPIPQTSIFSSYKPARRTESRQYYLNFPNSLEFSLGLPKLILIIFRYSYRIGQSRRNMLSKN